MTDKQSQSLERLVMAAVTAALVYFGGAQTRRAETSEAERFAVLANYRSFILDTMKCECPEDD